MEKLIVVIEFKKPAELLGASVTIHLTVELNKFWFKILETGTDQDGSIFIKGFDIERMNRKIYIRDIKTIVM